MMGLILGIGFPPFRGGPLKYLDQHGLDNHCQTAQSLLPISSLYQPPQLLVDMAANQQKFYPL
jgi:3-hydroxyacyl-CoA dehydrogenase/enoyl-CoA hydratase/3-hydroxybutyryl-CoA epimerase/enoyl-CoA isomerase